MIRSSIFTVTRKAGEAASFCKTATRFGCFPFCGNWPVPKNTMRPAAIADAASAVARQNRTLPRSRTTFESVLLDPASRSIRAITFVRTSAGGVTSGIDFALAVAGYKRRWNSPWLERFFTRT